MGSILPKPVECTVIERHACKAFRVGVAEVNGWRNSMEDAHLIHLCDDWAFFGVFDGHGGDQCSKFVANNIHQDLRMHGCPKDDAALKRQMLSADKAFLDTKQDSGSTGTTCIVHKPANGGKIQLRLANVGDSRVLLGRRDGSMVHGSGTDHGLTTDHKPEHPSERERIYRCGGYVEVTQEGGPARVNGELSVSRCFGDAKHKITGGPGPEDHPVTADPELGYADCGEGDFLLLVCDGVSEGDFPNAEVVRMVAAGLKQNDDLGAAAKAVCHKAIEAGSKDNISCMVVLLTGSGLEHAERSVEFIPGQLSPDCLTDKGFMTAYESMAARANLSLAQAAEMRYETVVEMLSSRGITRMQESELQAEVNAIGTPAGTKGSSARSSWFSTWESKLPDNFANVESQSEMICRLLAERGLDPSSIGMPAAAAPSAPIRRVRVSNAKSIQRAVADNAALEWDPRMADVAGSEGEVMQDDPSDGTSQVCFRASNMTAWLPTCVLIDIDDGGTKGKPRGGTIGPAAGVRRGQLPPTPPRADGHMPSVAGRSLPRPEPSSRGLSPSGSSVLRTSGSRFTEAPRLPVLSASVGSAGRTFAAGSGASSAVRVTGSPANATGVGNRAPRAVSVGYRETSPGGSKLAGGIRERAGSFERTPAGRQARSTPPYLRQP